MMQDLAAATSATLRGKLQPNRLRRIKKASILVVCYIQCSVLKKALILEQVFHVHIRILTATQ